MREHAAILITIACAACGRIGFEASPLEDAPPDIVLGHDEDEDGVADVVDVCPHLSGSQDDSDGDRVGDDCDPEPSNPRQRLVLFSSIEAGVLPFTMTSGEWTPRTDAVRFEGDLLGHMELAEILGDYRMVISADIIALVGDASRQRQIGMGATTTTQEHYFVELSELPGSAQAAVIEYDAGYSTIVGEPLPTGMHTGHVNLEVTQLASTATVAMKGGWDGETYTMSGAAPFYQGGTGLQIFINNLTVDVRFVWIVGW